VTVKSITGDAISLDFIGLCVDSKIISEQMKKNDLNLLHEKIEKAVELAVKNNCLAMGFGGYTSIITKNCQSLLTNSIALTSGNSLTVGMGIEALIRASEEKNINLETACFAAIGAAGNIASIYSEIMSEKVPKIVLIGKDNHQERLYDIASKIYLNAFYDILNNKNLEGIAKAIYKTKTIQDLLKLSAYPEKLAYFIFDNLKNELGEEVPIQITRDLNEIIKANIILSATNSSIPIIFPEMLKEGNIVICDISVPTDTDKSVLKKRDDVEVIKGGVVSLPLNLDFSINGMPLEKGTSFACMAETLLLGLTEITENYSYGRINKSQVKKIMELAKLHGFTLARVKNEASY